MIANKNVSGVVMAWSGATQMKERSLRKSEFASNTNFLNVCSMPDALNLSEVLCPCRRNILQKIKNAGESKDELFSG